MENEKKGVHDKDISFKLGQIDINTITPFDLSGRYIFVFSCHGSELDKNRNTILNEGCLFETIALGNRFGHIAWTDAHDRKAISLHEENDWVTMTNGNDIINKLSTVNENFGNEQTNHEAYFIDNLTTDLLQSVEENDGQILYNQLNPMNFQIKRSDYDGLLDPSGNLYGLNNMPTDPSANEAYNNSQIYTNAFATKSQKMIEILKSDT